MVNSISRLEVDIFVNSNAINNKPFTELEERTKLDFVDLAECNNVHF